MWKRLYFLHMALSNQISVIIGAFIVVVTSEYDYLICVHLKSAAAVANWVFKVERYFVPVHIFESLQF